MQVTAIFRLKGYDRTPLAILRGVGQLAPAGDDRYQLVYRASGCDQPSDSMSDVLYRTGMTEAITIESVTGEVDMTTRFNLNIKTWVTLKTDAHDDSYTPHCTYCRVRDQESWTQFWMIERLGYQNNLEQYGVEWDPTLVF